MVDSPEQDEDVEQHRRHAIECNNSAWELAAQPEITAEEKDLLLNLAHCAAHHWSKVGTPLNVARADMLLARAHAIAGNGTLALRYAERSHDFLASQESPDWEMAFSHAMLAHAHHAAGQVPEHAQLYAQAQALGKAIADPEDRKVFLATFDIIPKPETEARGETSAGPLEHGR